MALGTAHVTWSRGGNPPFAIVSPQSRSQISAFANEAWWTGALPDIVLAPLSLVTVRFWWDGHATIDLGISNVVVTVSRQPVANDVNTGDDTVPLLTPENLDEQAG